MELPGLSRSRALSKQLPPGFGTADDAIGILIGQPKPDFPDLITDMPLSPVAIVPVTLVLADELLLLRSSDASADRTIVARLKAAGIGHKIALQRPSVL